MSKKMRPNQKRSLLLPDQPVGIAGAWMWQIWRKKQILACYCEKVLQIHSEAWHSNRTKTCQRLSERGGWGYVELARGLLSWSFQVISDIYLMCRIRYIGKISSVPYKVYLIYVVYQIYQICAKLKFEFLIIETLGFVDIIISIGVGGSKVLYLRLQIN